MKLRSVLTFTLIYLSFQSYSQSNEYLNYIFTSTKIEAINQILISTNNRSSHSPATIKVLFPDANIYKIFISVSNIDLLEQLMDKGYISNLTLDSKVEYRRVPNDPRYPEQKNMTITGAEVAWNSMTGGLTPNNHQIVAAILDDGFQVNHQDLLNNTWSNTEEIPNDGIDNDNNGYIDDYKGLNVDTDNDDHPSLQHGTAVAGIIGAEGNNNMGIVGLNWDIKMMYVSQANFVSEIIEGYNYIYEQRKRFNESNGSEGALVVTSNFSAGIDGAMASDYPAWCAVYDKLGEVGILSVVATTNSNSNVDEVGDMPSTCASKFMIAVTNTTQDDSFADAGQGSISVDLSAPGTGTLTTDTNDTYDTFGGTSGSTPHVAGSIALLYSSECTVLADLTLDNPSQAAIMVRDAILEGGDPILALEDITTTGKRLNVQGALEKISVECGGSESAPLSILNIKGFTIATNSVFVTYTTDTTERHQLEVFDVLGRLVYSDSFTPTLFGQKQQNIDTSMLSSGVYYVTLSVNDQKATKSLSIIH